MTPVFSTFVARQFDLPLDNPYIHVIRFFFWSLVAILSILLCLFAMEIWIHALKYGWIREIYQLLTIIKVREQRTIDTHDKVDKTLQKIEEKTDKAEKIEVIVAAQVVEKAAEVAAEVVEKAKINSLIQSNPQKIEIEIKNDPKTSDNC